MRDRRLVLGLLLAVYSFNFIDRTIITVLQQPIKIELGLSDTQLGLLSGTAFALFYSVLGLPIARLAERYDRSRIIAVSLGAWSLMTMLCGAATSFVQLLLFRVGVGIGEAGGTPPAHALIADLYPPDKRATAISIYSLGVPIGILFGAIAGGALGQAFGWRAAFFVVGAPGLVLAAVVALMVRDPRTSNSQIGLSRPEPPPSFRAALTYLLVRRAFVHLVAGITMASTAGYGILAFTAPYFMRQFDTGLAAAGVATGVITGLAAGIGTMLGGVASDFAGRRDVRFQAWIPAFGLFVVVPLSLSAYTQQGQTLAVALLMLSGIFQFLYLGPTYALVQTLAGSRMRATASALVLFTVNLVGLGIGPPLVGWLSDYFAHRTFDTGGFGALCGGGAAQEGLETVCAAASAEGLRVAMMIAVMIFAWGAIHYVFAARHLRADLARSQ